MRKQRRRLLVLGGIGILASLAIVSAFVSYRLCVWRSVQHLNARLGVQERFGFWDSNPWRFYSRLARRKIIIGASSRPDVERWLSPAAASVEVDQLAQRFRLHLCSVPVFGERAVYIYIIYDETGKVTAVAVDDS